MMGGIKDTMLGDSLAPYPLSPGYKELTTSRAAARAVAASAPLLRERVFTVVQDARLAGLTPDEAAAKLGVTVLAVRPRFTELAGARRIEKTGERRANVSGLKANVWRAL